MKQDAIEMYIGSDQIRIRQPDKERAKSMVESAKINARIAKAVPLYDDSATLIFREIYESVRQLGDAKWWLLGYEPRNHEVCMEILKDSNIKERLMLNHLSRFKRIRNDANYRGFKVKATQAKEIIDFWDKCSNEIAKEMFNN
ncbi:hypothetical protein HYU09_01525 [Candidatus Woesearchaeota archaeon]|nr:hypothetical protein [Candidatus Woesearchaeota archaeon]